MGTSDGSYGITREQFINGSTFFAWDFSPDGCNGFHFHNKKLGKSVDLELRLTTPVTHAINIIVYATFETELKLINGVGVAPEFVHG